MFNKTILVFYINIGNLDCADVTAYIENAKTECTKGIRKKDKKEMFMYFIPIRGESRIERLDPPTMYSRKNKRINDSKLVNINKKLDRMDAVLYVPTREILIEKVIKEFTNV